MDAFIDENRLTSCPRCRKHLYVEREREDSALVKTGDMYQVKCVECGLPAEESSCPYSAVDNWEYMAVKTWKDKTYTPEGFEVIFV